VVKVNQFFGVLFMNERIKELLSQSGVHYEVMPKDTVYEKFAELIVQECLKCSDKLSKHYIENHPEKEQVLLLASIADYSNQIKQHFGVDQ
jgi:hypothetical protein